MHDVTFALRQLRKSPGFTLVAVFTLALGIGMNTAIFSLIHDLFLRRLPFNQPERVVRIYGEAKERDLKETAVFGTRNFGIIATGKRSFPASPRIGVTDSS